MAHEPLYNLICSHNPLTAGVVNEDCEVYWGSKEDMEVKYQEFLEDNTEGYSNLIISRMVVEAQLAFEEIDYGDEE